MSHLGSYKADNLGSSLEIDFNRPFYSGTELENIRLSLEGPKFSGAGPWTQRCEKKLAELINPDSKVLITTSCTAALEMAALLLNIGPGDEVIMPSFTFVSTANAFALRGAKIAFVDVEPVTMNLAIDQVKNAITARTKAVVVVHYGGVSCRMDELSRLCKEQGVPIVEDAAQGLGSSYQGRLLGSWGEMSCFSFHETKNIHCGEGGALVVNSSQFSLPAEMIREKGTNRSQFLRGEIDKYTWQCLGSSYLANEMTAAFLSSQLDCIQSVTKKRIDLWSLYRYELNDLHQEGFIELAVPCDESSTNGHLFYIKLKDLGARETLRSSLRDKQINSSSHYIPLHSSSAGLKFGYFAGKDVYTTKDSERLLRLPMYYDLTTDQVIRVCDAIKAHYDQ